MPPPPPPSGSSSMQRSDDPRVHATHEYLIPDSGESNVNGVRKSSSLACTSVQTPPWTLLIATMENKIWETESLQNRMQSCCVE
ncbi:hypothetical protein WN51_07589 [Melipona quadrifasciata]|uniref:Uncharacterized protein n=1 Tax=Melipona quadrifasciata TaxID=166423 RepID=A0A0N0BC18_9HYME|nr:hypothetical protein WN51_07589 [Melipona quadrifasciata]